MTYHHEHESTFELGDLIECPAWFDITTDAGEVTSCRMYRWDFNGRQQKRDTLVALVGHVEVNRIEEMVVEEYYEKNNP